MQPTYPLSMAASNPMVQTLLAQQLALLAARAPGTLQQPLMGQALPQLRALQAAPTISTGHPHAQPAVASTTAAAAAQGLPPAASGSAQAAGLPQDWAAHFPALAGSLPPGYAGGESALPATVPAHLLSGNDRFIQVRLCVLSWLVSNGLQRFQQSVCDHDRAWRPTSRSRRRRSARSSAFCRPPRRCSSWSERLLQALQLCDLPRGPSRHTGCAGGRGAAAAPGRAV